MTAPAAASPWPRRLFAISLVVAVLPMIVAAAMAIHRGWVPIGDDAIFAIRSRDVLTRHPPLLGTWTSASLATHVNINNPGPLLYDALALPTTLFGSGGAGVAVGVAIINVLSAIGFGIVAYRRGGALVGAAAMAVVATLAWTMGSIVLTDPVQPNSLVFPFLLLLALVWSVACDDLAAIPWLIAVASFLLESYITYVYLIVVLLAWAAVRVGLHLRRVRRAGDDTWPGVRGRAIRIGVISGVVFLVCWALPIWEQFTGNGSGNISHLLRSLGHTPPSNGFSSGTRLVAQVVTTPAFWFRPSYRHFLASGHAHLVPLAYAVVSLAALLLFLGWFARLTARRGDGDAAIAILTAVFGLVGGIITAARIPSGALGVSQHTFRWLWPLAAFATFAVIIALAHRFCVDAARVQAVVVGFLGFVVVFAALNLPSSDQGSSAQQADVPVVRDLADQLARAHIDGPVLVDFRGQKFADPYGTAVLAQLQRHSIPFVSPDQGLLLQLGSARRYDGTNAKSRVVLREGDAADVAPPSSQLLARHDGLTASEHDELHALQASLAQAVAADGIPLNARGRKAVAAGEIAPIAPGPAPDPQGLFTYRVLVPLAEKGYLGGDPATVARYERYASLQRRWDDGTVAVYLTPLDASA